ncbi:MAG: class I SAM-dependent methyltransferase [Gammaproteobacteria bacterium]
MSLTSISRTALLTSLMRTIHSQHDPRPLIDDRWGRRLMPAAQWNEARDYMLAALKAPASDAADAEAALAEAFKRSPTYAGCIVRTRYTEECLRAAVERGVRQYVILGAGLDSFALRQPPGFQDVQIIEIDHPATQATKRQWLHAAGVDIPPNLHLLAVDFSAEDLHSALARSPLRHGAGVFFACLGVTMYLPRAANMAMFRTISEVSAPGSELVFTYIHERELDPATRSKAYRTITSNVSSLGEGWLCGFDPDTLGATLAPAGLRVLDDYDGERFPQLYDRSGAPPLRLMPTNHCARVAVVQRP